VYPSAGGQGQRLNGAERAVIVDCVEFVDHVVILPRRARNRQSRSATPEARGSHSTRAVFYGIAAMRLKAATDDLVDFR
jgi:hypothetical protein